MSPSEARDTAEPCGSWVLEHLGSYVSLTVLARYYYRERNKED
jgi:hypothetical protein